MHRTRWSVTIVISLVFTALCCKPELVGHEKVPTEAIAHSSEVRLPEINPLEVEGNIIAAGSATVFPLSQVMYDRFISEGYSGIMRLDSINSSAGFRLFCQKGISDIAQATRPISQKEIEACANINREPIGFRVGTDALAVVVNPENDFVRDVTLAELALIFTAEKWSDVNPNWPNEKIIRFVPDRDSDTLYFFVKEVLYDNVQLLFSAFNTKFRVEENDLIEGVAANKYAIGFFSYADYKNNAAPLKIISINGVVLQAETVNNGSYILTRPLLIYSDSNIIREKPQVGEFINFYLTNVNEEISQTGYFPARKSALNEAKLNLLSALEDDNGS